MKKKDVLIAGGIIGIIAFVVAATLYKTRFQRKKKRVEKAARQVC